MSTTLSLALEAREPLCLEIYSFHDLEYVDENYAFKEPAEVMTRDLTALNKIFRSVSRRINGRCKGLLERNGDRMEFLHRTVYDFLRTDEMSEFLRDHTRNSYSPSLSLLKAYLAWIKRSTFACENLWMRNEPMPQINGFVTRLRQGLQYARLTELQGESSMALTTALLDNMEHSITRMLSRGQIEMTDPSLARDIFRQLVLEAGVGDYVRSKLNADPKFFTGRYADWFQSPLYLVLSPSCKLTAEDQHWILDELLKGGHDPQQLSSHPQAIYINSPWCHLFVPCLPGYKQPLVSESRTDWQWADRLLACAENNILLTLLKYGTNPAATVTVRLRLDIEDDEYEMPIWLVFLLAVTRVHSCKRPEAYEETVVAMLRQSGSLQNVVVGKNANASISGMHANTRSRCLAKQL